MGGVDVGMSRRHLVVYIAILVLTDILEAPSIQRTKDLLAYPACSVVLCNQSFVIDVRVDNDY